MPGGTYFACCHGYNPTCESECLAKYPEAALTALDGRDQSRPFLAMRAVLGNSGR